MQSVSPIHTYFSRVPMLTLALWHHLALWCVLLEDFLQHNHVKSF